MKTKYYRYYIISYIIQVVCHIITGAAMIGAYIIAKIFEANDTLPFGPIFLQECILLVIALITLFAGLIFAENKRYYKSNYEYYCYKAKSFKKSPRLYNYIIEG